MHKRFTEFLRRHPRLVVLTGAGVSAHSGIPTYRDDEGRWLRAEPIQHQDFLTREQARKRYWCRSLAGWPAVQAARPNAAHRALARLEALGRVELLITQNVDRLHQRAGSRAVVDLHGRLDRVVCLDCLHQVQREQLQDRLALANPELPAGQASARPDGDADVADEWVERMSVPNCERCDGMLMPDVVFFGGSVPRARVQRGLDALAAADALLVVGSSLQVYSGFRFCRHAAELGLPIAILNPGRTRADELASLKISAACGPVLEAGVAALARAGSAGLAEV